MRLNANMLIRSMILAAAMVGLAACAFAPTAAASRFALTSPDFSDGGNLGDSVLLNGLDCHGPNISPALQWSGAPAGTSWRRRHSWGFAATPDTVGRIKDSALNDDFDFFVRRELYDATIRSGRVPPAANVASALGADVARIDDSFARLAAAHIIVLGRDGSIVMAAPFAGVPTLFRVTANGVSYFANCIWDALGIAAMLRSDAVIETRCDDCGDSSTVVVDHGSASGHGIVHFAIPAHRWWDNIVFT
jgi:hypothetical protein